MITENKIDEFLSALASASPTPGGGSAAALIGAIGAGLISMVCNVTLSKKGLESVEADMRAICAESEALRSLLAVIASEDIEAFDALMKAYRLPKHDTEKVRRSAAIQESLTEATRVPLECVRACAKVIEISRSAALHGYVGVISDAGVGVLSANAALRAAALNVQINAPLLADRLFATNAVVEVERLQNFGERESEAVFELVRTRLS